VFYSVKRFRASTKEHAVKRRSPWTDEEDATIIAMEGEPFVKIAAVLKYTPSAIEERRYELRRMGKLSWPDRNWRRDRIAERFAKDFTIDEIATACSVSVPRVREILREQNLIQPRTSW
jgi:hypothetical protein